jgi:hypothetical protein
MYKGAQEWKWTNVIVITITQASLQVAGTTKGVETQYSAQWLD